MKKSIWLILLASMILFSAVSIAEQAPAAAPTEAPAAAPSEAPAEAPAAAPSEAPVETLAAVPATDENVRSIDAMGAFTVKAAIPGGYTFTGSYVSDILYVGQLIPSDRTMSSGLITVAFDEEADGRSIGDLSQDVINAIVQEDIKSLGQQVSFTESATSHGTKLLVYQVKDPEEARFEIYTLYKGYQIRCIIFPGIGQTLNETHLQMAVDFVSEVWIEE